MQDLNSIVTANVIFTLGHSNQPIESFLSLLSMHQIDVLVDTRSFPVSKFAPWFDQDRLKFFLNNINTKYLFFGKELGGRPKEPNFYDEQGHVLYWKIAESEAFKHAIKRIQSGMASYKIALLCSEEDPSHCHRRLLISRVLQTYAITVHHIRKNGSIQTEDELKGTAGKQTHQMSIFSPGDEKKTWKSIQSVLPKKPLLSSSNL